MIYLDNAATTLKKPEAVKKAVLEAMDTLGNAGRGVNDGSLSAARTIYQTRMLLSDLFHVGDPARVAFTCNSTEALNTAIKGTIDPGDHVITTVMEHNSVLRPLYELREKGVSVSYLPCDELGRVKVSDFEEAITPATRAIVCTHASNLTGNRNDIAAIGAIARKHGLLFIVDASQTAGVFPIDMQKMGIDILCFTGHKSLYGPQGTGGICVREGLAVRPLKSGGSGVQTYEKKHPTQMPTALEAGTLNGHGIAGLGAAVSFINEVGVDTIHRREIALMRLFLEKIRSAEGLHLYGDYTTDERAAIVALNIGDLDSSEVSDALSNDYDISIRSGAHCAPMMHESLGTVETGAVRFSFSYFNTEEEVLAAAGAVCEIARQARKQDESTYNKI